MRVAHPQKIKIRRRIYLPQRAIQIKGRNFRREVEPLREHDLKNIAGGNIFLAAFHAAQKALALGAGMHLQLACLGFRRFAPECRGESRGQLALQCSNVAKGAIIGAARSFANNVGGRYNVNLMPQMIESQQPVEEHQLGVGQLQIILRTLADLF